MLETAREKHRMASLKYEESVHVDTNVRNVQPLRDLIAAEMASSCFPRMELGNGSAVHAETSWGPSAGNHGNLASEIHREDTMTAKNESQELRFLFAKDWSMQNSDNEDEFWDSGTFCGAVMTPRRRTKTLRSEKKPPRSSNYSSRQSTKVESSRSNSLSSLKTACRASQSSVMQRLNAQSPGLLCSRLSEEPGIGYGGAKPSLGALLAAEAAVGQDQSSAVQREGDIGSVGFSPRWSAAVRYGESSRHIRIGSSWDDSAPVHPESHTGLNHLYAKSLTSGTGTSVGDADFDEIQRPVGHELDTIVNTSSIEVGLCCTSESLHSGTNLGEEDAAFLSPESSRDKFSNIALKSSTPPTANGPNLLPDPPIPEVFTEVMHPSAVDPILTVETALNAVSDAGFGEESIFNNVGDLSQSNAEGIEVEEPQAELETVFKQAWGEHGWLPLGRSRMNSPFLVRSPSLSRSNPRVSVPGISSGPLQDDYRRSLQEVAPRPSHAVVDDLADPEILKEELLPGSDMIGRPEMQQPSDNLRGAEGPSVDAARETEILTSATEQPPRRVSLLSLLNQDMENIEKGLDADKRVDEQDEHVTEQLDPVCCVCMVGHKGAAFIPCGHTFCRRCCREVRRSKGSCPLCNKAIIDVLNIY